MEKLDKEFQVFVVEKVLEEMEKTGGFLNGWNASWWEKCLDVYSTDLSYMLDFDLKYIEEKYNNQYDLTNAHYPKNRVGDPLRKVVLLGDHGNKYECEFGRIEWYVMNSLKSSRHFSFCNNGNIIFLKDEKLNNLGDKERQVSNAEKGLILQRPKRPSYNATYNVLTDDFIVNIKFDTMTGDFKEECKHNFLTASLKGNFLISKLNDIEIIQDLRTNMKIVNIVKEYDKNNNVSVVIEATFNPDNNLEMGVLSIDTHKSNGKVNGTYRFDVSRKKGISATFYSRKGSKVDLTKNPMLLEKENMFLLHSSSRENSGVITKNLDEKVIKFDNSDFDMESIRQVETKVIEMLKSIKGELPLPGLIERINKYLDLINREQNLQNIDSSKVLKIQTQKK